LGERYLRLVGEDGGNVFELVDLGVNLFIDLVVAVADTDGYDAAEEIEILIAVDVPDVLVFGVGNDEGFLEVMEDRGKEEFFLREEDLLFGHCLGLIVLEVLLTKGISQPSDAVGIRRGHCRS